MDTLLRTLSSWKPFKVLVVGDFMLDQFQYGDAERLSPDAPVPVLLVTRQENRPGGAANLCLALAALKGRVTALGVVGRDTEADALRTALLQQGIDASGLVIDPSRPTTVKSNLIGLAQGRHPQKMFRLDHESHEPLRAHIAARLLDEFDKALAATDIVCIEDYGKGVCSPELCAQIIERAHAAGKPVFADPAQLDDYSRYSGVSAITPNRTEAARATGREHNDGSHETNTAMARELLEALELDACVLTLDKQGALLLEADADEPTPVPTEAREVYDVTGAGDMMLGALAAARANKLGWLNAVRFANAAAGLEVEVFGVVAIPLEQVHNELLNRHAIEGGRVRTIDEVMVQVGAARRAGKKIVFTNGCFDVLHAGHIWLLDRAREQGAFLVVGLNTDASVRRYKGENRPVNTLEDRIRVLGSLSAVDAVAAFDEDTPVELIKRLRPDVLVKGAEYEVDEIPGAAWMNEHGGRVVRVPLLDGLSTTDTLEKLGDPRAKIAADDSRHARFIADQPAG